MTSSSYTGSLMFLPLSKRFGIPIDQLNFVLVETSGIFFGLFLRLCLPHSLNKPTWRLIYCLTLGLGFLYILLGKAMWMVLLQVVVCYLVMKYFPEAYMHSVVFYFALGYLVLLYCLRYLKDFSYMCYDETYPLMVTTQKITTLAFGLSDWGLMQKGTKMVPEREKYAVRKLPGFLEYMAFTLSFQGVLAGPFCHYKLYRAFIQGNTQERLNMKDETDHAVYYEDDPKTVWRAVGSKFLAVVFWTYLTASVKPFFPEGLNSDPEFIANNGVFTRLAYVYISLFFTRSKYYVTWILADAVYNASGLGYVGKDDKGRPQWTGMTNVNVIKLETATNLKVYLDNWNIMTTHWLRHACYTRAPFQQTMLTFILSALWHGVHPGYYITFVGAAFFVLAGRKIRANFRPLFQGSRSMQMLYDLLTMIGTQSFIPHMVLSFVILDMTEILRFHHSFYWFFHVLAVVLCIMLPSRKGRQSSKTKTGPEEPEKSVSTDEGNGDRDYLSKHDQLQHHSNGDGAGDGVKYIFVDDPRVTDIQYKSWDDKLTRRVAGLAQKA